MLIKRPWHAGDTKKGKPLITDYEYRKDKRYFAQIEEGLKNLGAKELAGLGARNIRPRVSRNSFPRIKPSFTGSTIPPG
ncbi:MAG: hypothetical protein R2860_13275 [Desulfobacterales bacterium]